MAVGAVLAASSQYCEQYLPSVTVQLQAVCAHFFGSWDIGESPLAVKSVMTWIGSHDFRLPRSAAGFEHLFRVLQAGLRHGGSGDHACDFSGALLVLHLADLGPGAAFLFGLFDEEMLVS